ncbi:MAG: zinc-ribbon domain-containing protein [Nitrospinae bacterium]|nr:zinc-ribbon domain-containing protein [Nitrospinota bacterium]
MRGIAIFCPKCGTKTKTGDNFCSKCGTKLP